MSAVAGEIGEKVQYEETGGLVDSKNIDGGRSFAKERKVLFINFVTLKAVRIQSGHLDFASQFVERGKKRRVGIISLNFCVDRCIFLSALYEKSFLVLPFYLNAESFLKVNNII